MAGRVYAMDERVNVIWFENIKSLDNQNTRWRVWTLHTLSPSHTHTRARKETRERERLTLPALNAADGRDLITHRRKKFNMQFYEFVFYHLVGLRLSRHAHSISHVNWSRIFRSVCMRSPSIEWKAVQRKQKHTKNRKNWARLNDDGYREGIVCIYLVCVCVFVRSSYRPSIYLPNIITAFPCTQL